MYKEMYFIYYLGGGIAPAEPIFDHRNVSIRREERRKGGNVSGEYTDANKNSRL